MTLLNRDQNRRLAAPSRFPAQEPVFTERRTAQLSAMISAGLTGRMRQKWADILLVPADYVPVGPLDPWYVPGFYVDTPAHHAATGAINADARAAVDLAVRWAVLRNPVDAEAVARILSAWLSAPVGNYNTAQDSRLVWSTRWPMMIQSAQLISDSPAYTLSLKTQMEDHTAGRMALSSAYVQTENRAVWGCVLETSARAFLGDRPGFLRAIARWRELFNHDVSRNIPIGEVRRDANALHYCNFLVNAMTQTAEIARFNGEWLYDYQGPDGSTFRGLWENVAMWSADPDLFPYWRDSPMVRIQAHVDPLHALWPNQWSQALIDRYTTTQDYFGYRQGILAYRGRLLYD